MSRYDPIPDGPSSPTAVTTPSHSRRSSFHSIRNIRFSSRRPTSTIVPNPREMDAAFDGPDVDDGDEGETHELIHREEHERSMPGDYDFERDYTLPPPSPPPFQSYSASNPAPGNTHGVIPTSTPARPAHTARHFLGGILPTSFLPRQSSQTGSRVLGGGMSGVFDNLAARPEQTSRAQGESGLDYIPEDEQKDAPPSYQSALRDAVPPYWDTTVVLPSSNSPFGPLSSSISGDEVLIDGMPSGNFFGFFWNLIVSVSFQFVGFLLTYVLHTTHAAKYGSRAGLGLTLIQVGLNLRSKAEELIKSGHFPAPVSDDPSDPPGSQTLTDEGIAENAIEAMWGPGQSPWPASFKEPGTGDNGPVTIVHNTHEAELWAQAHNTTLTAMLDLPSAAEVGKANEYFSFLLMSVGWFIVLTSVGGWWRVKRFERGLRTAQRESEEAQVQAAQNNREVDEVEDIEPGMAELNAPQHHSPRELAYYLQPFRQALAGAQHIREGFLGLHGSRLGDIGGRSLFEMRRGQGHTAVSHDSEGTTELFDASGYGLEPMASASGESPGANARRQRGLWG
ncbi:uncharacterized protein L203_100295 [Cryptococcus depauperatus CBS 7841]|uniref:Uncharacterized protein n=1 Tax=Cryptococcus depauperatus CBS 7841 TaxID=1295531 RepID=A0A1E3IZ55_9TREE|nr:metal homeostatis protein bsd2 [Cryptococcus depauperatus CBS 7841]ODN99784.1 metal homeostatis protein bsd2 [Cryptococcus depauperatus CBS 7855]